MTTSPTPGDRDPTPDGRDYYDGFAAGALALLYLNANRTAREVAYEVWYADVGPDAGRHRYLRDVGDTLVRVIDLFEAVDDDCRAELLAYALDYYREHVASEVGRTRRAFASVMLAADAHPAFAAQIAQQP